MRAGAYWYSFLEVDVIYAWLSEHLNLEFEEVRLLKEGPQGSVRLIRRRESGQQLILRRFTGNGAVYLQLPAPDL